MSAGKVIGITAQDAPRMFLFIGLASSIARLVSGKLCNKKAVNPVYFYQASMLLAGLSALGLPFSAKYWHLVAFSFAYGLSDGVATVSSSYIMLSCVDSKRITASFCINNMLYSFPAAAGGPIAGELVDIVYNGLLVRLLWFDILECLILSYGLGLQTLKFRIMKVIEKWSVTYCDVY